MQDRTAAPLMITRAGAALAESAAEPRALQTEIVAEDVEQRRGWVDIHRVRTAVHLQIDAAHLCVLSVSPVIIDCSMRSEGQGT